MGKVITWGGRLYSKEGKAADLTITNIYVDPLHESVRITYEEGIQANSMTITMNAAEDIGFINFDALNKIMNSTGKDIELKK